MGKKLLFFFILNLNYSNFNASDKSNEHSAMPPVRATLEQRYKTNFPLSQNDLQEMDPTATGNPFPLTPTSTTSVSNNSFGKVSSLYSDRASAQDPEEQKNEELIYMSILCCPCFELELVGFKKSECCSCCCCCSQRARIWCFSCCMM